jgi:DNA polymerase-3 subunit beta
MDIYIDRDELSRGLARVQGVIERRSTHPLLSHVLLHAREGGLRMTATDTEVAFIGDLAANVEKPGQIAVDAANLFQIVRAMPESTVHLTVSGNNRFEIRSGRSSFKLPGFAAEEFPALPAFDGKGKIEIPEGELKRLVDQTHFAVAPEDLRYGLNGVHMERQEIDGQQLLRFVATDGHRLSAAQTPVEGALEITPRMLVPRKALGVIKKLLGPGDAPVELSFGDGAVRLSMPGQSFWFRLLDGEFPDYQAVVPTDNKVFAMVHRDALLSALRRVGILVSDRAKAVRFAFGEDELEIQVQNVDRGEVKEAVPIELDGQPITVGFNAKYLAEILGVIDGDQIRLSMAHPLAPCLVEDPDVASSFFVVMPMRLD